MSQYEIAPDVLRAFAEMRDSVEEHQKAFAETLEELQKALGEIVERFQAVDEVSIELPKFSAEELQAFDENRRRWDYWQKNAPDILKKELSVSGLIVPLSEMTFDTLAELVDAHAQGGGRAVVARLRQYYDEIFGRADFLVRLEREWSADPRLARRWTLLRQALDAHREGKYALSIPVLLTQFEGLVADVAAKPGHRFPFRELKNYVATEAAKHPVVGIALSSFVSEVLYTEFLHGQAIPAFSRHAILHGGDVDYATESNARTAILAIEEIRGYLPSVENPSPGC